MPDIIGMPELPISSYHVYVLSCARGLYPPSITQEYWNRHAILNLAFDLRL